MKATWLYGHAVGIPLKFTAVKKRLSNGKKLNTIVALDMAKSLKNNKIKDRR